MTDVRTLGLRGTDAIRGTPHDQLVQMVAGLQWELAINRGDSLAVEEARRIYKQVEVKYKRINWAPMPDEIDLWEEFETVLQSHDDLRSLLARAPKGEREQLWERLKGVESDVENFGLVQRVNVDRWSIEARVVQLSPRGQMFSVVARHRESHPAGERPLYDLCRHSRINVRDRVEGLRAWHAGETEIFPS